MKCSNYGCRCDFPKTVTLRSKKVLTMLLLIFFVMGWGGNIAWAAPILPGPGEEVNTGYFVINAGETAVLGGMLTGNAVLQNYGELLVRDTGGFAGGAALINEDGSNVRNDGIIPNLNLGGTASLLNNGSVQNLFMTDDSQTLNNGTVKRVRLFAGDNDTVNFQNNGSVYGVDADVYSPANNGFINIANNGSMDFIDIFDNVPIPPGSEYEDLITVQNTGSIRAIYGNTSGVGQLDIFIWGSLDRLFASGSTSIWVGSTVLRLDELIFQSKGETFHPREWIFTDDTFNFGKVHLAARNGTVIVTPVPEPATILLLSFGFIVVTVMRRKFSK